MPAGSAPEFLVFIFLVVNGVVFFLYAADKRRAATARWRISESLLLCSALIGPFGAFFAMRLFRHKTQKLRFFVVPLFCLLQILAILWFISGSS
ncbi:MAG: DUF1294 domain-containing protein [Methanoregula sp.]|nr:MAG: DUF1294 domain-containing protein [Methanoregula sp.]